MIAAALGVGFAVLAMAGIVAWAVAEELHQALAKNLALPGLQEERAECLVELAARAAREAELQDQLRLAEERARALEVEVEELRAESARGMA